MRASLFIRLSVCAAFASSAAIAQVPASVGGALHTQIEGINIPHVANAPFRAKVIVKWDQPLVGGGTVSKMYYTMVARDSQGRVRRETRGFIPANSSDEPPLRTFTITDPIAGTRTTCTETAMNCTTGVFRRRLDFVEDSPDGLPADGNQATRQSLGKQTLDGLPVIGTRVTAAGMAGSQGTRRVALTSTEVWYSPDLHVDLSVIRNNPQLGTVALTVTELVRGEPDPSWFAVPSGFAMNNGSTK